jgi:dihydropteroate synthase
MASLLEQQTAINHNLSHRFIALDPGGYFLIYIDPDTELIYAKHFTNDINDKGLAVDPQTGEPFPCNTKIERSPTLVFQAKTAKELCIQIFETSTPSVVTKLDHAAYLGRELMRAELALATGQAYIQD